MATTDYSTWSSDHITTWWKEDGKPVQRNLTIREQLQMETDQWLSGYELN